MPTTNVLSLIKFPSVVWSNASDKKVETVWTYRRSVHMYYINNNNNNDNNNSNSNNNNNNNKIIMIIMLFS